MSQNVQKREADEQQQLIGRLVAGLFAVLGLGVIITFLLNVANNPNISGAETTNSLVLNFLDSYGIIIPLLVFGLGLTFINYARKLFARDIITSGWAQLTMFWGMVFSVLIIFIHVFQVVTTNISVEPDERLSINFLLIGGLIVFGAVAGAVWWWITQHRQEVYNEGEETIASRESLVAWNLLIPTVVILILVAARPLERTFIASLTDRTFAGSADQEVNFIGIRNYTTLLGFRFDTVSCVTNEDGSCQTRTVETEVEDGETVTVDLDSIEALEPATLDVGLDFFNPETLNNLLANNEDFSNALASAIQAQLAEDDIETESVEVISVVEGNLVEVNIDGETQEVAYTGRLTNLENVDLSDVDLNYADDVSIAGLNTYRIRSPIIRNELDAILQSEFNIEEDDTIDDVDVEGFEDFNTIDVTITRLEISEENVYESVRDKVGEAYQGFSRVSTLNLFGNRIIFSARDAAFFTAVGNTLFFTLFTVIAELVLGMIIAMAVNTKFLGQGLMRAAMLVPWAIPTVVSAKLWEYMLLDNRTGVINDVLIRLGIIDSSISWLANSDTQIWSLIFVDVWKTTPFMALLLLAGLQTIPSDVYEAADVDGAGPIRQFFSITLPLLRPTIAVALVFRTLDAIRAFDVFEVLLGRQLQSMATYNQFVLVERQEFGYASAIGVTIFIIILIFTVLYVRILGVDTD